MRRSKAVLLSVVILLCAYLPAQQQQRGPSTPEERQRFVAIAKKLELSPLDPALRPEREWALLWLIQVPDFTVHVCTGALGSYSKTKYKYSPEITGQLMLSSGAFIIEHPEKAGDRLAEYAAAAEGALNAYQAILAAHPEAKLKELDQVLEKRTQGQLADFVKESTQKNCK